VKAKFMLLRTLAALVVIALAPTLAAAAASAPPAPITALTNALIHGTNSNDLSSFAGIFTDDAIVVDENAPFVWRGAGAGVAWWRVVQAVTRKAKIANLKATHIRTSEFKASSTDAYMIETMTITGAIAGKPFAESGTLTYTFHNAGGKWLISTMVWTTKPS
jgi:ketosteroid isomerase-like protein